MAPIFRKIQNKFALVVVRMLVLVICKKVKGIKLLRLFCFLLLKQANSKAKILLQTSDKFRGC